MKKGVMIAILGLVTSLGIYASNGSEKQKEKAQTECCDKTTCCPTGTATCK